MGRLLTALLILAAMGAVLAAAAYQPEEVEREQVHPKFRLAPGEGVPDFIEPVDTGEEVTVNITVLRGGPVDVFVMNMENLTVHALNGSTYSFEVSENVTYNASLSRANVTGRYDFTLVSNGEDRLAVLLLSRHPDLEPPEGGDNTTEVAVTMRYTEREERTLVIGYLLAAPSALLVGLAAWRAAHRRRRDNAQ